MTLAGQERTKSLARLETLLHTPRTRSASVPLKAQLSGSVPVMVSIANGPTPQLPSPRRRTVVQSQVETTTRSSLPEPVLKPNFTKSRLRAWNILLVSLPSSLRMLEHAPQEPLHVAWLQRNPLWLSHGCNPPSPSSSQRHMAA